MFILEVHVDAYYKIDKRIKSIKNDVNLILGVTKYILAPLTTKINEKKAANGYFYK